MEDGVRGGGQAPFLGRGFMNSAMDSKAGSTPGPIFWGRPRPVQMSAIVSGEGSRTLRSTLGRTSETHTAAGSGAPLRCPTGEQTGRAPSGAALGRPPWAPVGGAFEVRGRVARHPLCAEAKHGESHAVRSSRSASTSVSSLTVSSSSSDAARNVEAVDTQWSKKPSAHRILFPSTGNSGSPWVVTHWAQASRSKGSVTCNASQMSPKCISPDPVHGLPLASRAKRTR